jgi:four helix bundle protein
MTERAIESLRDLDVWRRAMELAVERYRLTSGYPKHELYGLTSQTRRAATSIASNIAEGHARQTAVYRNHVNMALGSQAELDTVLELAVRLGYVSVEDVALVTGQLENVGRMLHRVFAALERKILEASKQASDGRTPR